MPQAAVEGQRAKEASVPRRYRVGIASVSRHDVARAGGRISATAGAERAVGSELEPTVRGAIFFPRGALEGVVAPRGQADGAVAQLQRLLDCDDCRF